MNSACIRGLGLLIIATGGYMAEEKRENGDKADNPLSGIAMVGKRPEWARRGYICSRRGENVAETNVLSPGRSTASPFAAGPPGRLKASTGCDTGSKQKKSAAAEGE